MDPTIDGPTFAPIGDDAYVRKLKVLEAKKADAVAVDDLELALHFKHAISVLKRSARL